MKTYFSFKLGLAYGLVLMLMVTSCETQEIGEPSVVAEDQGIVTDVDKSDPTLRINNSVLFPTSAKLFGKSNEDWAFDLVRTSFSMDCEEFSTSQLLNLSDKVVSPFGDLETITREYTITKDQFVFLSPIFIFNFYGCPEEFGFEPEEGQSIEDFLRENSNYIFNLFETFQVFYNGVEIEELSEYKISSDLFYFTANPTLTECVTPCLTGKQQPSLFEGYFMMFKKMKFGKNTVIIKGSAPELDLSFELTFIFNVTN
ncbi:MAG TPA: hypothetical protein VK921_14740 [Anditalea sp.]|nr:hypothetical protein [Anditalea sp.]